MSIIFLILVAIVNAEKSYSDDQCGNCIQRNTHSCQGVCVKHAKEITSEVCAERCIKKQCSAVCEKSEQLPVDKVSDGITSGEEVAGSDMNCEYCMRQMRGAYCQKRCAADGELTGRCVNNCAKKECGSKCNLPDRKVDETGFRLPVVAKKRQCRECRNQSRARCGMSCRRDADQPGFETCVTACEENSCAEVCYPQAYR